MGRLSIALFGGLRVWHGGARGTASVSPGGQRLLGLLLIKRNRAHTRDELTGLLWPDCPEDRARACLNTELWRLRRVLEPRGTARGAYLQTRGNTVEFNPGSNHWLDVAEFERLVSQVSSSPPDDVSATAVESLKNALQLYAGELLEGIYDDWVLFERECMRSLYIDGLAFLMACCKRRKNHADALRYGQKILELDPLREEIHRELMRLYMACGQRPQALVQFRLCQEILQRELNIPPMDETQAIYAEIVGDARRQAQGRSDFGCDAAFAEAMRQIRTAMAGLQEGQAALQEAVSLVQRLANPTTTRDD